MITIIPFIKRYQDQVQDLILSIQNQEFDIPITLAQQQDLIDIPSYYQKGSGNFWVALDDEKVVGTIALIDIGNRQGVIRKMFVQKEYRGKTTSTAKLLLDMLMQWSIEQGMKEIYLGTTAKFLAAHRFYEKNGFVEIDKESLPHKFPIMIVDTKFYKRINA